jgi:hypothetical protein
MVFSSQEKSDVIPLEVENSPAELAPEPWPEESVPAREILARS